MGRREDGPPWRAPLLWRFLLWLSRPVVAALGRLTVTGAVPAELRRGPLILAVNHISVFDPVVITAASRKLRLTPRMLAAAGLFRAPVVGSVMRACGHIRVNRFEASAVEALDAAAAALAEGSVVVVYPEGRLGLDPHMWPERGRTGAARLAFVSGATVLPVAQWGAHEVLPYGTPTRMWRTVGRAVLRRPRLRVHVGPPVDLGGLDPAAPGAAQRATDRIMDAIIAQLGPLRADEPELPRFVDPTRPTDVSRVYRRRVNGAARPLPEGVTPAPLPDGPVTGLPDPTDGAAGS